MRIRTVKPEWWTHPFWSKQKDEVRLLALALLNYADDEGYFYADTEIVRGQLMPHWDSVKVHGALSELSKHGWIELCKGPGDYGPLGRVANFDKHQRINRASPSRISEIWGFTEDSLNDHGGLTEPSVPDQGTGIREQGSGNKGTRDDIVPRADGTTHPVDAELVLKPEDEPPAPSARPTPVKEIVAAYNRICTSMPQCRVPTDARKAAIRNLWRLLKEDMTNIELYFEQAQASEFLSGRNGRWKACNIDWLTKKANAAKVLEGNYDTEREA